MYDGRYAARNVRGDFDALVVSAGAEEPHYLLELATQLERTIGERQFARLGLGEIEHVVDERDERLGRRLQRAHEAALLGVERGVLEQRGHAHHTIERCAQLVAHVGEETRLRLHGSLRRHASLLEHFGSALLFGDVGDHRSDAGDGAVLGHQRCLGDDDVEGRSVPCLQRGLVTQRLALGEQLVVGLTVIPDRHAVRSCGRAACRRFRRAAHRTCSRTRR